MLAPNALTTVEAAAQFLGLEWLDNNTVIEHVETDEDGNETIVPETVLSPENLQQHNRLILAINQASAMIERYCRRKFGMQTHKQLLRRATDEIICEQYPVLQVLDENAVDDETAEGEYPAHVSYIDNDSGIVYLICKMKGTFDYVAGYVLPKDATDEQPRTLPYDLEQACFLIINEIFVDEMGYIKDANSLKLGDWQVNMGTGGAADVDALIPTGARCTLDLYRKVLMDDDD